MALGRPPQEATSLSGVLTVDGTLNAIFTVNTVRGTICICYSVPAENGVGPGQALAWLRPAARRCSRLWMGGTSRFALLHTSSTYHTRRGIGAGRVREVHGMIGGFNSPCSSIRNTSASVFPCTWVVREDSLAQVEIFKSTSICFRGTCE